MTSALSVVLPWVIVAVAAWLGYRLVIQNGRILLRITSLEYYLEALEEQIGALQPAALPEGLPAGVRAPIFQLPDLDGKIVSLEQYRSQRLLLVFFNPECSFCQGMAPDLAALPWDGSGGLPVPVVVSAGDLEVNRAFVAEHGIRCPVLRQEHGNEIAALYGALGTPLGYLVDEHGILASPMVMGADHILALAKAPNAALNGGGGHVGEDITLKVKRPSDVLARHAHRGGGLKPRMVAPPFSLPRLDGGRVSLGDYRGRRLLLVFSSSSCPACDQVLPELEAFHRRSPDLPIVMVTRGEPDENRAKVAELGLTFPVALQQNWEVSRKYRKFATPAAYLIDEEGEIAAPVAVGGAILTLAAEAAKAPKRKEVLAPVTWRKFR
jgi:peroxiredoxin